MLQAKQSHWDVVICGAGPVALTLSILLSRLGIQHLVIERRSGVNPIPRARGINCRTVEIWDRFGLSPELDQLNLPAAWQQRIVYKESLAGELIGTVPIATSAPGFCAQWSPADVKCIAQDKTDAMLLAHAQSYPQMSLLWDTVVGDLALLEDVVRMSCHTSSPHQSTQDIHARWLVACDGAGSGLRQKAGIGVENVHVLDTFINAHFHADLHRWVEGLEAPLMWMMREGYEGVFAPLDGKNFWRCQINFDAQSQPASEWTEERVLQRIREMIDAPEAQALPIQLHSFFAYTVRTTIAQQFRKGHFLLAGDAAHQIPPFGAMGMNTGVQSAHNLAWKLAAVIRGQASTTLLDSYESERKEVAKRVCDYAVNNHRRIAQLRASKTPQERRDAVRNAKAYGNSMGLDLGVHYEGTGAYVQDSSTHPQPTDPISDYIPCAKPGYRAPHLWLDRQGERISSLALFEREFVLLAGKHGHAWVEALATLKPSHPIVGWRVASDGDLQDTSDTFESLYGISDDGMVVVRPDGHVASRCPVAPMNPRQELERLMTMVLGTQAA